MTQCCHPAGRKSKALVCSWVSVIGNVGICLLSSASGTNRGMYFVTYVLQSEWRGASRIYLPDSSRKLGCHDGRSGAVLINLSNSFTRPMRSKVAVLSQQSRAYQVLARNRHAIRSNNVGHSHVLPRVPRTWPSTRRHPMHTNPSHSHHHPLTLPYLTKTLTHTTQHNPNARTTPHALPLPPPISPQLPHLQTSQTNPHVTIHHHLYHRFSAATTIPPLVTHACTAPPPPRQPLRA